jgi:MFS transporter, PPP family, 3-phenylpropionic acid transporter
MVLPSTYYLLSYCAISFLFPFLALYYKSQGLTGGQIGLLVALIPLLSFFGAPLWTGMADATHRHKLVTAISLLGVVIMALILPGVSTFAGLVLAISLYAFLGSPTNALTDSAVLSLLGPQKAHYGRIRLWGTIGYGAMAPIAGEIIDRFGLKWSFWGYAILTFVALLIVVQIPFRQSHSNESFAGGMRSLVANRSWMLFLVMVFFGGIGMATINYYLFVYMESLGASKFLMGLALLVGTASEIPALFFGNRFLKRFGAHSLLIIAMTTIGLRLICYSLVTQPWAVLIIQMIHGLTVAMIIVAGVSYADQVAPAGMKATTQGMFNGVLMGIGAATGCLLGGVLMDHFSAGGMYAIVGGIILTSLIAFLFVERWLVAKVA